MPARSTMTQQGEQPQESVEDPLDRTVIVAVPAFLIRYGAQQGIELDSLLKAAKLTLADLGDLDRRVSYDCLYGVWELLRSAFPERTLCLDVAGSFDFTAAGVVGALIRRSDTLGQALDRVLRYQRYFDPALSYHFERGATTGRLVVVPDARLRANPYPLECIVGMLAVSSRLLTPQPVQLHTVDFEHAAHHDLARYRDFFGCEVRFGQAHTAITFDLANLDAPIAGADPLAARYLEELTQRLISESPPPPAPSFAGDVRSAIRALLTDGQASQKQVAKHLAVSVRTLQRRLQEEGTSYVDVHDEVLRDTACTMLQNRHYLIADVAFVLGYAEPSSFYRAFKRWMGCTPEQFRQGPTPLAAS